LYATTLLCESGERSVEINENDLDEGSNQLVFSIDNGEYLITDIKITNKVEGKIDLEYEFDVDEDQYNDILVEKKEAILEIDLEDGRKKADIEINDYKLYLDTHSDSYKKDISEHMVEGENTLRIVPKIDFEIDRLKIYLEEE
jgi:hypothetical protein